METKSKNDNTRFSVEERKALATVPWMVGAAVSEVDKGGDEAAFTAEMRAMNAAVQSGVAGFSGSTMIDLVTEHNRFAWQVAQAEVASKCEQALALLTKKGTPDEVEAYKRLIMDVAYEVAAAAGSGFAGLGKKISAKEAGMIDRIATAIQATQFKR